MIGENAGRFNSDTRRFLDGWFDFLFVVRDERRILVYILPLKDNVYISDEDRSDDGPSVIGLSVTQSWRFTLS